VLQYFVTNTSNSSTNGTVRLPVDKVASYKGVCWSFDTDARFARPSFTTDGNGVPHVSGYVARAFTGPEPALSRTCTSSSRRCPPPSATSE
jgi:hypothetical protein